MNKEIISTDEVKAFLSDNMEKFARFANQVIRDEKFLKCAEELLPFDGVAHASMNVAPEVQTIKKMGVTIMRMDLEPPLFSLAVTISIDWNNEGLSDISVFLTACKTIKELQEYVNGEKFREEVTEQSERAVTNTINKTGTI